MNSNHVGGCQTYDPFWGTLNIRCRIVIGIQQGPITLTTTHVYADARAGPAAAGRAGRGWQGGGEELAAEEQQ